MINKDISIFDFAQKSIIKDHNSETITPVSKTYMVIQEDPLKNIQEIGCNRVEDSTSKPTRSLSEEDVISILDNYNTQPSYSNEDSTNVAYQEVQKLLKAIPSYVSNISSQALKFSDLKEGNIKSSFTDDTILKPVSLANTEKTKKQSKSIERSIIDGDIQGAFAGPNKTYPVTCAGDVKKIVKESKSNDSLSFKRIVNRALSIGKKYGWLAEELTEIVDTKSLANSNKILLLSSDNVSPELSSTEHQNIVVLNSDTPEFIAFEDVETNKMMLKIPAGRLGEWIHPEYGFIEFTQEKFDQAIDNFNAGVLGYEPTLNVGHFVEVQAFGSAPTEGIALEVYQEEDVLYTNYECFNKALFNDVLEKKYRRSSSELVMDYVDRTNGRYVGMTLVGMALTNKPFITDMPTISVFSDNSSSHLIDNKPVTFAQFNLYENDNTNNDSTKLNNETQDNITLSETVLNNSENMQTDNTADTSVTSETVTIKDLSVEQVKTLSTEIQQTKVAFETAMKAQEQQFSNKIDKYAQEREELLNRNAALELRIAAMEAEKESKLLADKVSVIRELDLSEEQKDSYIKMFTEKTFGSAENENTVLNTLVKTFGGEDKPFAKFTRQLGDINGQVSLSQTDSINPYTALIERNKNSVVK